MATRGGFIHRAVQDGINRSSLIGCCQMVIAWCDTIIDVFQETKDSLYKAENRTLRELARTLKTHIQDHHNSSNIIRRIIAI
jgi:hypothetical protein